LYLVFYNVFMCAHYVQSLWLQSKQTYWYSYWVPLTQCVDNLTCVLTTCYVCMLMCYVMSHKHNMSTNKLLTCYVCVLTCCLCVDNTWHVFLFLTCYVCMLIYHVCVLTCYVCI